MYNNIGGKIKGLAITFAIIEAVLSFIGGFVAMVIDEELVAVGFVVIVVGFLTAWISSWLLYGFGEIVENTGIIARNSRANVQGEQTNYDIVNTPPQMQDTPNPQRQERLYQLYTKGEITAYEYHKALENEEKMTR